MYIRDTYITLTDAAKKLAVHRITLRRWIRLGRLEAEEIGGVVLIKKADLEGLVKHPSGRKPRASEYGRRAT